MSSLRVLLRITMDNEYKVMVEQWQKRAEKRKNETIDKKLNDRGNSLFYRSRLLLIHEKSDCEPREDVKCHENIYMSEI